MTRFKRLTSFKRKKLTIDDKTAKLIDQFAAFVSGQQGQEISPSDIIGTILMEGVTDKRLKFQAPPKDAELNLNLPESAWDNLKAICEKHEVGEREVLEKLIQVQAQDKGFQSFIKSESPSSEKRKNPTEEVASGAETPAPH